MTDGAEKALLFAGLPHEYLRDWDITSDLDVAAEKLGVQFEEVPLEELTRRYDGLGESDRETAAALAEELISGACEQGREDQPARSEIEKATRLYMAVRQIMRSRDGDAMVFNCPPWRSNGEHPVPCVTLTLLQDEGIPSACQGDIDALLTMIVFKRASGQPSFMGGAFEENGHLAVSHCVMSRRMDGPHAAEQPYYLADYHGNFESPTVHTDLLEGQPVTVGRLTRDLEGLILTSGCVAASRDSTDHCRNTLLIDVDDVSRVLEAVVGIQYHLVVAAGDHTDAMMRLADEAGIEVLAV